MYSQCDRGQDMSPLLAAMIAFVALFSGAGVVLFAQAQDTPSWYFNSFFDAFVVSLSVPSVIFFPFCSLPHTCTHRTEPFPAPCLQDMFTCLTTANFPDILLPAYRSISRVSAVYFVLFMVVGFYLVRSVSFDRALPFFSFGPFFVSPRA